MLDMLTQLKSRLLPRRSAPPSLPTLPLELIYMILDLLPPPAAWYCRPVCRTWAHYIEHTVARSWLLDTRIDMINMHGQPTFRIYSPNEGSRHGICSFPYLRREGRWAVYGLQDWHGLPADEGTAALHRPLVPYLHPLAYIEYAKEREALTPRYTYELRRLCIHITVTHLSSGFHTGPSVALRSKWHPRVLQGSRQEGFRLDLQGGCLRLDWRVLYSSMFLFEHVL